MMKAICCFILCTLTCLQSKSRNANADSLHSLFTKISSILTNSNASCNKATEYTIEIVKIEPASFSVTLARLMAADSLFLKANKNNNCSAKKLINSLDTLLRSIKIQGAGDSISILKAIRYGRYKCWGFICLTLQLNDKQNTIQNPDISVNAFEPSVIPVIDKGDSTAIEIFILPGKKYFLNVSALGYMPYRQQLIAAKQDTTLSIQLKVVNSKDEHTDTIINPPVIVQQNRPYWWISSILLFFILLALVWKMVSDKRKAKIQNSFLKPSEPDDIGDKEEFRRSQQSILQLHKQIREKDDVIKEYVSEMQTLQASLRSTEKNSAIKVLSSANPNEPNAAKYFLSEIMMTAGPRKKPMNELNADKDLGEDVCGFIMAKEQAFVWLLDGTSDFYCLRNPENNREYFSSRLLAQSVARKLKLYFAKSEMEALDNMMVQILSEVKSNWVETINLLPVSEKNVLTNNIKAGNFPECAATVLVGCLTLSGNLIVYRSGDSKMLVYGSKNDGSILLNTTLSSKNPMSNDRIFFRLILTPHGELDIQHNQPIYELVKQEKVQTIIGFSDGIGKETEKILQEKYPENADVIRNEIIYQLQGTEDDKALYIVEIKSLS